MITDLLIGNLLHLRIETKTDAQKYMKMSSREVSKWLLALLIITSIMATFSSPASAQLRITADSGIIGGSEDQTSFWLHINRHGIHSGEGNQLYANTWLSYLQTLSYTFTWVAGRGLNSRSV